METLANALVTKGWPPIPAARIARGQRTTCKNSVRFGTEEQQQKANVVSVPYKGARHGKGASVLPRADASNLRAVLGRVS
jgi:hypothetical protein